MSSTTVRVAVLAGVALAAVVAPALPAQAQPAASAAAAGDIIVTAQRREQLLQDVPISVTALGAAQLRANSIETASDLALRTPGLTVGGYDPVQLDFSMRGIGSTPGIAQGAGGNPSVVVFVDGVYAGRGGIPDLDSLDLERVEVLRGPQGTLFGKNAIGGLIQFISRKPDATPSLFAEGTYGNFNRIGVTARGNVPLADNLYLSAGFAGKYRDGYEYNETTGNRVNDEKMSTGQLALRYLPTETLDITLRGSIMHQDQKGNPRHNSCDYGFAGGVHCVGINPDPRVVDAWTDGKIKRTIQSYSGEINLDTGFGAITSLTAYRHISFEFETPFFSNPVNPPNQIESTDFGTEKSSQFSQELRMAFHTADERLSGQVGVYYLNENINRRQGQIQQFPTPAGSGIGFYPQKIKSDSLAAFGQVDFEVLPRLTLTAGARMTWEKKVGHFQGYKLDDGPGLPPPLAEINGYDVKAAKSWKALTPRFAVNWKATDAALLYASVSRGYKSGGYQGLAGTGAGAATPYDPEYAWSYEAGAKTDWFDNALRLNLAVYHTNYSNLQVSQLIPLCCVVVTNAARARINGAEAEFVLRPVTGLQLDGSYAYTDAKFSEYAVPGQDYTDNELPRAPKHKLNIGGQVEVPVGSLSARLRADYSWVGDAYFEASNIPQQLWPSHENLDARLTVSGPDSRWEFSLWGKNLTDALVPTYVTWFAPFQQSLTPYLPPRTYGVTLSFRM